MKTESIASECRDKMNQSIIYTSQALLNIRTNKASVGMVENIPIEVYNCVMKLKEVSLITTPSHRMILIDPWDKSLLNNIHKSIQKENIGINPTTKENKIYCPISILSKEMRNILVDSAQKVAESGRIKIRSIRKNQLDCLKKIQKKDGISEDENKRYCDIIQKITNESIDSINNFLIKKKQELLCIG